jgi:SRSO17 transposase
MFAACTSHFIILWPIRPGRDEDLLAEVRCSVLPAMEKHGPVVAWIVDDTGFPKKGKQSVGVAHQYCGQLGKQDNCRTAVSLSVATWGSSLPVAYRLCLPGEWANDAERREKAGVPEEVPFQTKPQIALDQIRQAVKDDVPRGVVLADAGYGADTQFRTALSELGLQYVIGVKYNMTVWEPGTQPLPPVKKETKGRGRPSKRLRRDEENQPVSLKDLAVALPASAWKDVSWREGTAKTLKSRFAAVRVRPAHRDYLQTEARGRTAADGMGRGEKRNLLSTGFLRYRLRPNSRIWSR